MAVEEAGPAPSQPVLTPRDPAATKRRRRWGGAVLLAVVLGALGVVLYEGLSNATVYFCNANEVGNRGDCTGNKRIRLQGTVDNGSIQFDGASTRFTVTYVGATIPGSYPGEPAGIFKEGIPVVVEGRMEGTTFDGDRILVKHTEQYVEENPGRVPQGAP